MAITRITKGVIKPNENYDTHNIVSTGIITSVGADINGDLDVDGHTNLDNVSISGVTTFSGSVNNLVLSGVVTTTGLDVNGNADISGNLSVGGVLTYEDVTSIDSIGIITARNDIHVGAGVSAVGVGTFGSLDIGGDIDVDGHTNLDNVSIAGVTTFASNVSVGNSITASGLIQANSGANNGVKIGSNLHIKDEVNVSLEHKGIGSIYLKAVNHELRTQNNDRFLVAGSGVGNGVGLYHFDGSSSTEKFRVTSYGGILGNQTPAAVATPNKLSLGAQYSSNRAVPKLSLYDDGTNELGFGVSSYQIDLILFDSQRDFVIYGGGAEQFRFKGDGRLKLLDGKKIQFGNSEDLQFVHEGGNSRIINTTGDLRIEGNRIELLNGSANGGFATETYLTATNGGAVELYHNNSKKLETKGYGIDITGGFITTGGSIVQDGGNIKFGTGSDLQIFHDNSNNINVIQCHNGRTLHIDKDNGAENMAKFIPDGAVELYHNNAKKLETTSTGATVTGSLVATSNIEAQGAFKLGNGNYAIFGASNGMFIYHTGTLGFIDNNVGTLKILSDSLKIRNNAEDHDYIVCNNQTSVDLYYDNSKKFETTSTGISVTGGAVLTSTDTGSSAEPEFVLYRNSASPADADYLGQIKFNGKSDTGAQRTYAKITGKILDASNGTEDGIIEFAHIKGGSQNISARFRSDSLQLLNGTALTVAGSTTVTGNIIPSSDSATDIGTNSVRFANIYADTLYGDGSNLTGVTSVGGNTGVDFNDNVKARFGNTNDLVIYYENGGADRGKIGTVNNRPLDLLTNNTQRIVIENSGHVRPAINNSYDLGTGGDRWRNVYGVGGNFSGTVTANAFSGDGSNLTGLSVGIAGISTTGTSVFNNVTVSGISTINSLIVENYDGSGNSGIMTVPWKLGQSYSGGGAGGGTSNQVWGQFAGQNLSLSAAVQNVIIGREAAKGLDRGDSNVFIGCQAGPYNDGNNYENCDNNTVVSGYSMYFAGGNAKGNSVFGYHASYDLRGAQFNTTVGYAAAKNVMNGGECVVIGHSAAEGSSAYHPNSLVAIGASAAKNITSAQNVIVIGNNASPSSNTPSNEITLGDSDINHFRVPGIGVSFSAGGGVVTGIMTASSFKLLDGSAVGGVESDAQGNTVAGSGAGDSFTGTDAENNTLFGKDAGTAITSADSTTAVGKDAGKSITTGSYNHLFGIGAGDAITTGYNNTIMGHYAGSSFQTASENTIIGGNAGGGSSLGSRNVIVGKSCNQNNEGSNNVFIGQGAIAYRSGTASNNVIIGQAAADFLTNGNHNAGVGQNVFDDISTGSDNSALGSNAGDTLTTGSNNLFLGHDAFPSSATVSNEVTIGDSNITKFRVPGINFILKDNGGTPTQGHVLTVDGNGEAGFAAVSADVVNDSSPQLGGDLASNGNDILMADNDQIKLGSSNDFTMYHDSSGHTFLQDQGNGALRIRSDSEVAIQSYVSGTNKNMAKFMPDGTVELYHNGNKKLHTFDSGVVITGDAQWMDNHDAQFGNSADLKIYHNGTHNYFLATNGDYVFDNGSSELARISQSGNFTASGFIDSTSDIKLKTNIKTIDNALDKVLQLRGAEYDRIDRDNQHEIGVIAQEVEKIIPEVVHGEDTKTVSYGNMVAVLIEAIKEQNEVINKMKKEIEDLKG